MKKINGNICIAVSLFFLLMILGCFLYLIRNEFRPTENLLSATIGVMIAILSIALPITIGNISDRLSAYNNKYIANIFREERSYKWMLRVVGLLILGLILFLFFSNEQSNRTFVRISGISIVLIGITTIVIFRYFIKRCIDYAVNTDDVVFQIIKKRIDILKYNTSNFDEQIEVIDVFAQIIFKKISSKSYIGISDICKSMSEVVVKIYDGVKIENKAEGAEILRQISVKYYDANFRLWLSCFDDSPDTSRIILDRYEEVLSHTMNSRQDNYSFEPLLFMYQRIANEIDEKSSRKTPFCKQAPWEWYFNIVFDDAFDIRYLTRANMYLFSTMKLIVENNNSDVFEAFVANVVDGMWSPKTFEYPYSNKVATEKVLSGIKEKAKYIYTPADIEEVNKLVKTLNDEEISTQQIQALIHKQYKFNNLQLLSSVIGAYCLFKRRADFIQILFFYNQPKNSSIQFANTDIVPENIQSAINWYNNTHILFRDFFILWDSHNDINIWFKKFMAIMMCRIMELNKRDNTYRLPIDANKQVIEYQYLSIKQLKEEIDSLSENQLKEVGLNNDIKQQTSDKLDEILIYIDNEHGKVVVNQELDKEKVARFKQSIEARINDAPIWINVFRNSSEKIDNSKQYTVDVGLNELLPKSFLAQGDSGMYVGFPHSISEVIVNQIDFYIERILRGRWMLDSERLDINKSNFKTKVLELTDEYIVIFINYFSVYDFLLHDKDFQWKNKTPLLGVTSKGSPIMSFGDPANKTPRLIILKQSCFSKINIDNQINIDINDLNLSDEIRENIIKANPGWLEHECRGEDKHEFLKQQVQIIISGKYSIEIAARPNITFIEGI